MSEPSRWMRVAIGTGIAILIPMSVLLLCTGISDYRDVQQLDEEGIEVPADVVHVRVHTAGENGPTSTVTVRYRPRGEDVTKVTTEVSYDGDFDADHPDARSEGTRVEYDPADVAQVRIVGETGDALDRIIGGAVFLVVLVVSAVVWHRRPKN